MSMAAAEFPAYEYSIKDMRVLAARHAVHAERYKGDPEIPYDYVMLFFNDGTTAEYTYDEDKGVYVLL